MTDNFKIYREYIMSLVSRKNWDELINGLSRKSIIFVL